MQNLHTKATYLRDSHFLKSAPEEVIGKLALDTEELTVHAGDTVFHKGESGSAMYFLVDGRVRVHDDDIVLKHLGNGEVFGEIGALASEQRTASITAETDCLLYRLEQERFYDALNERPEAARSIIKALCERERGIVKDVTEHALKTHLLEREMEIGRKIQSGFLPDNIPELGDWQMLGTLSPAREVAGDFYDFFEIPGLNRIAVVIGDVCDKGVGAALFMTLFRSLLRANALAEEYGGIDQTPVSQNSDLFRHATATVHKSISLTNNYIARTHGKSSMFASVFFGLLDPVSGELVYINAGHEAPILIDAQGDIDRLQPTGPVIGLFPDIHFETGLTRILPGTKLFAFTDGIPEAKNVFGEEYGEDQFVNSLTRAKHESAGMLTEIMQDAADFVGDAKQYDDMTLISVLHKQ